LIIARQYPAAQAEFEQAVALKPDAGRAVYQLGRCHYMENDYNQAETLFRRAILLLPNFARPYQALANLQLHVRHRPSEAEPLFRKAMALDPAYPEPVNGLALVEYKFKSDYIQAETLYKRAIDLDPGYAPAYGNLAVLTYQVHNNYPEAERLFKRALYLEPRNGLLHANFAVCLLKQRKRDAALAEAIRAQALGLKRHPVFRQLGLTVSVGYAP
jgi:Flp pilus assembly protein TadD